MVMDKDMAIASLAFPSIYYLPLMNTFVSSLYLHILIIMLRLIGYGRYQY